MGRGWDVQKCELGEELSEEEPKLDFTGEAGQVNRMTSKAQAFY